MTNGLQSKLGVPYKDETTGFYLIRISDRVGNCHLNLGNDKSCNEKEPSSSSGKAIFYSPSFMLLTGREQITSKLLSKNVDDK